MTIERTYFGTDGIRGMANRFPITSEIALAVGKAAAHIFVHKIKQNINSKRRPRIARLIRNHNLLQC